MTTSQEFGELPEFEHAPVVETVLSVKFRTLPGLDSIRISEFWRLKLRESTDRPLPIAEERPPYFMPVEIFEGHAQQLSGSVLQIGQGYVPPRYWFISEDQEDLVQLQSDWVALNWRKRPNSEYKRYVYGRTRFEQLWTELEDYLKEFDIGVLVPIQCELTYINHIHLAAGVWDEHDEVDKVTTLVGAGSRDGGTLPKREGVSVGAHYRAVDDSGQPFGRLHVSVDPANSIDDATPLVLMNLTFRGRPHTPDLSGVLTFFDFGHNWIVGGFDELTTGAMHDVWVRKVRE